MAIYIGDKEINGWYLGDKQVEGVYLGDTLIWPTSYRYVITAINILYSAGSQIYASASNYAYATGTVQVWRGRTLVETRTNQPLTPSALASGDTTHFRIDGANVKGYNLGTTSVTRNYSVAVSWTYSTSQAVTATTQITQQTNTYSDTITNAYISLQGANIGRDDVSLSLLGYITRYFTRTWTSTATQNLNDNEGLIDIIYNGSTIAQIENGEVYTTEEGIVTQNRHSTSVRYYNFKGEYDAYSSREVSIAQAADSYTESYANINYECSSLTIDNHLSAAGGYANLSATARHTRVTYWTWDSDARVDTKGSVYVSDGVGYDKEQGASSRFSISGSRLNHGNMAKDETPDTVKVYAYNSAASSARSQSRQLTVTNNPTTTTTSVNVGLSASGISCTDTLIYITASIVRHYSKVWPSGSSESDLTDNTGTVEVTRNGVSKGIISHGQSCGDSVGTNTHSLNTRIFSYVGTYQQHSAETGTVSVEQGADSITYGNWVYVLSALNISGLSYIHSSGYSGDYASVTSSRSRVGTWQSDGATFSEEEPVRATVTINYGTVSPTEVYQMSAKTITADIGTNGPTDRTVTLTATQEGRSPVSFSLTQKALSNPLYVVIRMASPLRVYLTTNPASYTETIEAPAEIMVRNLSLFDSDGNEYNGTATIPVDFMMGIIRWTTSSPTRVERGTGDVLWSGTVPSGYALDNQIHLV